MKKCSFMKLLLLLLMAVLPVSSAQINGDSGNSADSQFREDIQTVQAHHRSYVFSFEKIRQAGNGQACGMVPGDS